MMKKRNKRFLSILLITGLFLSVGSMEATAMTYRDNAVTLQGSGGIQITGGTFTVKELSITSGQDPDGRNYIGQVHTLSQETLISPLLAI